MSYFIIAILSLVAQIDQFGCYIKRTFIAIVTSMFCIEASCCEARIFSMVWEEPDVRGKHQAEGEIADRRVLDSARLGSENYTYFLGMHL